MDRTLEQSQQLDVLFDQMLSNRLLQQQQQQHGGGGEDYNYSIMINNSAVRPTVTLRDGVAESDQLGYADEEEGLYCVEAQTLWTGKQVVEPTSTFLFDTQYICYPFVLMHSYCFRYSCVGGGSVPLRLRHLHVTYLRQQPPEHCCGPIKLRCEQQ